MTVEKKAKQLLERIDDITIDRDISANQKIKVKESALAQALRDQIEECAKIVEEYRCAGVTNIAADRIRALAEPKEEVKTNDR